MPQYTIAAGLLALTLAVAGPAHAQGPDIRVDDDEIVLTGCVGHPDPSIVGIQELLVWSRTDIMLAYARTTDTFSRGSEPGPFFYWIEDDAELEDHVGQQVEIRGELGDFEEGEVEVERDGDFTEITIDLAGEEETVRVPSTWLGPGEQDSEQDIVTRRIEVEDIRVLGPCLR